MSSRREVPIHVSPQQEWRREKYTIVGTKCPTCPRLIIGGREMCPTCAGEKQAQSQQSELSYRP